MVICLSLNINYKQFSYSETLDWSVLPKMHWWNLFISKNMPRAIIILLKKLFFVSKKTDRLWENILVENFNYYATIITVQLYNKDNSSNYYY